MTDSPYAIRLEELVDSARVPLAEQVVEQPERRLFADCSTGPNPDGLVCDADGQ